MKIRYQKDLRALLFALLVSTPALVSLSQVESAWTGVKKGYNEQDFGLSILRRAMLISLTSQHLSEKPLDLNGRIPGGGRLIWKTQESPLSACCGTQGRDRQQGTDLR